MDDVACGSGQLDVRFNDAGVGRTLPSRMTKKVDFERAMRANGLGLLIGAAQG